MTILLDELVFGESVRWHDGRPWLCDWGTGEVIAATAAGGREVVARVPSYPLCIDWLPDGRMLAVAGGDARLLRLEPDGSLVTHAELPPGVGRWNEVVVTPDGGAFVNGGEFVARIDPDGTARVAAEGLAFPNGMAVTADGGCLLVAESRAGRITAFDVAPGGDLSAPRAWAYVAGSAPDGICLGPDGSVWYADVPNRCCRRVAEGGDVLQTVDADRGCFSCALGGPDGATLFVAATEWRGFEQMFSPPATGQLLAVAVG